MAEIELFDGQGRRKYNTKDEVAIFRKTAEEFKAPITTFCLSLAYSGGRISEVLNLQGKHIDLKAKVFTFRSLKKHKKKNPKTGQMEQVVKYRQVPVPDRLLKDIRLVHDPVRNPDAYLWANNKGNRIGRSTAFTWVKAVFEKAGIESPANQPHALRHAFAINALQSGVPLNQVQKWLGHSSITTTAIYANAVGEEERNLAQLMWE